MSVTIIGVLVTAEWVGVDGFVPVVIVGSETRVGFFGGGVV